MASLGADSKQPEAVIASQWRSDLIYIPKAVPDRRARELGHNSYVPSLEQDYVSGLFVNEKRIGKHAESVDERYRSHREAKTPVPAIVVNFRSFASDCRE